MIITMSLSICKFWTQMDMHVMSKRVGHVFFFLGEKCQCVTHIIGKVDMLLKTVAHMQTDDGKECYQPK